MIQEDARSVVDREETDSIPLVDDIRYHIASNVRTYDDIGEAKQKLQMLEQLLVNIGLQC